MNKSEFIDEVASKTGMTKVDAKSAVEASLEVITEELSKGGSVAFTGFGTFSTTVRAARTARVPATGEEIQVPETRTAKFKVGKSLKDLVKFG